MSDNEMLWVERDRPRKISECILPVKTKEAFAQMVEQGTIQNMTLAGGPGMGKTTVARALCEELDYDYIIVNASEDGNIDMLRNQIRQFASTVSMMGGLKVVILDEADYLNSHSTQPTTSHSTQLPLTCNSHPTPKDGSHCRNHTHTHTHRCQHSSVPPQRHLLPGGPTHSSICRCCFRNR